MVHLVVKNVRKKVLDFWLPIGLVLNFVRKITVEPTVLFFSFSGGISMLSVQTMYIDKVMGLQNFETFVFCSCLRCFLFALTSL